MTLRELRQRMDQAEFMLWAEYYRRQDQRDRAAAESKG